VVYLLDTNAFALLIRQHEGFHRRLASLSVSDSVMVPVVVRGEIAYGLERLPPGRRRRALSADTEHYLRLLPSAPMSGGVAEIYGRIKRETELVGTPMEDNDLWIAATCFALDAILVTNDSDYAKLPELTKDDWSA
jgi:predicted nucleic acid-binding protein